MTQQQLKEGCSIQLIDTTYDINEGVYLYDAEYNTLYLQVQPKENNEPISFKNEPVQAYFNKVLFYSNISNQLIAAADMFTTAAQPFWPLDRNPCNVTSSEIADSADLTLTLSFPKFGSVKRSWRYYDLLHSGVK